MAAGLLLSLASGLALAAQQDPHGHEEAFRSPYAWPSLSQLVERSDTIVAGEVVDVRSAWATDRREIFTTVTLRADRSFKGRSRNLIRFRIPGGTVGDTRMIVTHFPQFRTGERTLVFLNGESGRLPLVTAGEAGKRHLRTDEDGTERILPGFALSENGGEGGGLDSLDGLARALSGPLASLSR